MTEIVVVEPQAGSREGSRVFLAGEGYSVREFDDPAEALSVLGSRDAPVDLAIVAWDARGGMSGSELLTRLKQRRVRFPRIVICPIVNLDIRNRAVALGAADLLLKPVDGDRLLRAVRKALGDPREADPLVGELRAELIGDSPAFEEAVVRLAQAIHSDDTVVLLLGESGVGKEVFAQQIHKRSRPKGTGIDAVNLAGLSPTLIESELFGHVKGAFTDAHRDRKGAFERAGSGTLFLDEIGYLALDLQPKLLRAIQERKFLPVGGDRLVDFEARLVCATSRNLAEAVKTDTFRQDLYHRVSEFEIRIPPLRERIDDIRPLADHFLKDTGLRLERETLAVLQSYSFPGNVRELQNILKHARAVCEGDRILPGDLPGEIMAERIRPLEESEYRWPESLLGKPHTEAIREIETEFDKVYLLRRLQEAGHNKERAARLMGVSAKTLRQRLRACGLGHLATGDERSEP